VRKLLVFLLLLAAPAAAQGVKTAQFATRYDLDAAALTYCVVKGTNGDPYGANYTGGPGKLIETSGSSTTVTAVTAGTLPFDSLGVGDLIFVQTSTTNTDIRVVAAKASGDSITVDVAVDWSAGSGFTFSWRDLVCGTTANDGWIDVSGLSGDKVITLQWDQGDLATGLLWQIECKTQGFNQLANKVYPGESADCGGGALTSGQCLIAVADVGTSAARVSVWLPEYESACRVGILRSGNDTSEAGTNLDQINIAIAGSVRK
jgi:hypothetical protein